MSISQRQIFESLTMARGREVAGFFGLEGLSGLSKDALVDALSGKRSLAPEAVLAELSRDELRLFGWPMLKEASLGRARTAA